MSWVIVVRGSSSEFNYWSFAQESAGGNILGFFPGIFLINFLHMCLQDQIFHVLLEHFISELVGKWERDQMF